VLDPPPVEQVPELASQLCQLPLRQPLEGPGPRHGPSAGLENQFDAPVRREARGWPPEDVCELSLELREGGVVLPLKGERSLREPERREVELRAVVKPLRAVAEPGESGRGCETSATTGPSKVSLTLRLGEFRCAQRFEGL
jgi:hypothetical protein